MTRIQAAFITLLIASVALAAYGDRISGNGPEFMPRDPGAARKDASNITAATWRTALDVYSKGEMDATLGSISAALDEIIGAP